MSEKKQEERPPETVTMSLETYNKVMTILQQLQWRQVALVMNELLEAARESGHEIKLN